MSEQSYLVDPPATIDGVAVVGLLTTCHTCMPNKASTCPDCNPGTTSYSIAGKIPDDSYSWGSEDIAQQATRSTKDHRWPYQFISETLNLGCNSNCVYLVRIQYDVTTSSARRSFFQCGFSDIWLVERWNSTGVIQELFCIASSLPFDIRNDLVYSDYSDSEPTNKITGSTAWVLDFFNPYGLRERYDQNYDKEDRHCGTLMFFARGNDIIKLRLAQHTNLHMDVDINPDNLWNSLSAESTHEDYLAGHSYYGVNGDFEVKVFTRPIPGALNLSAKTDPSTAVEKTIKYHPKIYA